MIKAYRFYLLYLLLGVAAFYVFTRTEVAVPANQPFELFPQHVNQWTMTGQARFDERTLEVLKPTDYLSRTYRSKNGGQVSLYIGYHDGGPQSGPIHSPRQCLPGSGWDRLKDEVREIELDDQKIPYVSATYQKETEKQMFLYWFQVRDEILTDEYMLKVAQTKNSVLANRRDSAFIRLSLNTTDSEDDALRIGEQFIRDFYPAISHSLPQ
ncbi:EpsI family protein [Deltaproteobacteria bacterium]|nr:EpsI family protein [Deltaproteobacteria bacterium]